MTKEISEMDKRFYLLGRKHIDASMLLFVSGVAVKPMKSLVIGPRTQDLHQWHWLNFDTLDIVPGMGCKYTADITQRIPADASTYDQVGCWDVLEHTLFPDQALAEIRRILKPGGMLFASAPWGFRIHGPQPDLHRMNQNTWRLLLRDWDDLTLDVLDDPDRWLMPIHINVSARCNKEKNVNPREMEWPLVT